MMKRFGIGLAILSTGLFTGAALAESVVVDVAATVIQIDDPYGVVGEIAPGDTLFGNYTYETLTVDEDPQQQKAIYTHLGSTGYFDLSLGAYRIRTDNGIDRTFSVTIDDENTPGWEWYMVICNDFLPSNGVIFDHVVLDLGANTGSVLQSPELTVVPPDYTLFNINSEILIHGTRDGMAFSLVADLTGLSAQAQSLPPQGRIGYEADAEVSYIDDPYGVLAGKIGLGGNLLTRFTYDLSTPNSSDFPEEGRYVHLPGTGGVSVSFADVALNTGEQAYAPEVRVYNGTSTYSQDYFVMQGGAATSNYPDISATSLDVAFDGPYTVLDSTGMPSGMMLLESWDNAKVHILGDRWYIEANITALRPFFVPAVEVFPADGVVHPMARFDMSLRAESEGEILAIAGSHNGQDITPLLAGCIILPKVGMSQTVYCPDVSDLLVPGANTLSLQLMSDASSEELSKQVEWIVSE